MQVQQQSQSTTASESDKSTDSNSVDNSPEKQAIEEIVTQEKSPEECSNSIEVVIPKTIETKIKLGHVFQSYEEFIEAFEKYKQETYQVFATSHSTKKSVNGKNKSHKPGLATVLYQCKYAKCVENCKSKVTGQRNLQHYSGTGCTAQIRINNIVEKATYTDKFKITKFDKNHNHVLDPNAFLFDTQYRILGKDDQKFAHELLSIHAQPADVARYLSEKTKKMVLPSDLNNIKQRMRYLIDLYILIF